MKFSSKTLSPIVIATVCTLSVSISQGAGEKSASKAASTTTTSATAPMNIKDVETLNDQLSQYDGKKVTVTGEVQEKLDARSFVLESGGLINDEIVVIGSKDVKGEKVNTLKDDANVTVTGTVRVIPVVEVRKELSWDLDPQVEAELQRVKAYVVADQITPQRQ